MICAVRAMKNKVVFYIMNGSLPLAEDWFSAQACGQGLRWGASRRCAKNGFPGCFWRLVAVLLPKLLTKTALKCSRSYLHNNQATLYAPEYIWSIIEVKLKSSTFYI